MKKNNFDLTLPFLGWFTSKRTEDIFYTEVKRNIFIYNIRASNNFLLKIIDFIKVLRSGTCKGIVFDCNIGIKSAVMIFLSKFFNFPIIMRLRGGLNGEFFDKIEDGSHFFNYFNAIMASQCHKRLLCASEKIFPVSIFSKSQILYELPKVDINKIKIIYKPVDFNAIDNTEKGKMRELLNIADNKKIILTATNFNYKRKFEALLYYNSVIVEFLKKEPDFVYIIVGGGAGIESFKQEIEKTTQKYIQNRVIVTGLYPRIYEALVDADLFLYMSYRDAGPQVVKEAQAARLPVIANYSCFGSNEFLPPDYNGRIKSMFEEKQELHDLLISIMKDENLRKTMGDINRKIAEEKYNPSKAAEIFLNELGLISPIK